MHIFAIFTLSVLLFCATLNDAAPSGAASCNGCDVDLLAFIDSSNSINEIGWGRLIGFLCKFVQTLPVDESCVQIAALQFSSTVEHLFYFNKIRTSDGLCSYFQNIKHLKKNTNTAAAFESVFTRKYFEEVHGARPGSQKVILLITDGRPDNQDAAVRQANTTRNTGIRIVAAGIGSVLKDDLTAMTGDKDLVFSAKSFKDLPALISLIFSAVCAAPTTTAEPTTTTPAPEPTTTTPAPEPTTTTPAPEPTTTTPAPEPTTTTPAPEPTATTPEPEPTTTTPAPEPTATTPAPEPTTTTPAPEPTTTTLAPEPTTQAPTAPPTTTSPTVKPCTSSNKIYISLLFDGSSSVGQYNFNIIVNSAGFLIEALPQGTTFSSSSFGTHSYIASQPTTDKAKSIQETLQASYRNSSTESGQGINAAVGMLESAPSNGVRVIVMFTDGKATNATDTEIAADNAHKKNITIVSVAIGVDANTTQLITISRSEHLVIKIDDISGLASRLTEIAQSVCNVRKCPVAQQLCLGVAIDASGSIGFGNFQNNLKAVAYLLEALTAGSFATVVQFGTHNRSVCLLTNDIGKCVQKVTKAVYQKSTTHTERGLNAVLEQLKSCPSNLVRTIITFTDGKSTVPSATLVSAAEVHKAAIRSIVVAIGKKCDEDEILKIATTSKDVLKIKDYETLLENVNPFVDAICTDS